MGAGDGQIVVLIVGMFAVFFPLMWVGIGWLLSRLSGWSQLYAHYPLHGEAVPMRDLRLKSLMMGYWGPLSPGYSGIVNIGVDDTYLYLSVMWVFKIGHKPLRIPFDEMEIRDGNVFIAPVKIIHTHKVPNVKIILRGKLVDKIDQLRETV